MPSSPKIIQLIHPGAQFFKARSNDEIIWNKDHKTGKREWNYRKNKRSNPKTKNSKRPKMNRENKFRVERSDDAAEDAADIRDDDVNDGQNQTTKNPNGTATAATITKR